MKYYWENSLLNETRDRRVDDGKVHIETIVFVPNLKLFIYNNKDKIEFDLDFEKTKTGKAIKGRDQDSIRVLHIMSKDGLTKWVQIEGIETEKDFMEWYQVFSHGKKSWSMSFMSNSIPHMCDVFLNHYLSVETGNVKVDKNGKRYKERKLIVDPQKKDLCWNDEVLYKGLSSSYLNGYSVINAEEDRIYDNTYFYDTSANHSSFMYYYEYPKKFIQRDKTDWFNVYKDKRHFYGEFCFYLKEHHPYLAAMPQYDVNSRTFCGWANDVDVEFLNELVGIERSICYNLYEVEMARLPEKLRKVIMGLYKKRDEARARLEKAKKEDPNNPKLSLLQKTCEVWKMCLEKIYGNCAKKRHYSKDVFWNEKENKLDTHEVPYDWETVQKNLVNPYHKLRWDYSIGVWTCSYARLQGLKIENALRKVGAKHLYSDIDCHIFQGKAGLKVIEAFNKSIGGDVMLGKFKSELKDKDGNAITGRVKFLGLKWYCIQDTEKKITVKAAGANNDIVVNYLKQFEDPVAMFTKKFPDNVKPFKRARRNEQGKYVYEFYSNGE